MRGRGRWGWGLLLAFAMTTAGCIGTGGQARKGPVLPPPPARILTQGPCFGGIPCYPVGMPPLGKADQRP